MRKDIEKLIQMMRDGKVSAYSVHKETGMSQGQLARLKKGESDIDNIALKNAEKLSELYQDIKKDQP